MAVTISATVPEKDLPPVEPIPTTAELLEPFFNGGKPTHAPSPDGRAVLIAGAVIPTRSREDEIAARPLPTHSCDTCATVVKYTEYHGWEEQHPYATRVVDRTVPYRYWNIWGECPRCLVPKVLSGEVKIEDPEAAEQVVRTVIDRTATPAADDWLVIGAAWKRARFDALRAAQKDLGLLPGDSVLRQNLPQLVSIEQVAKWWSVGESTVRAWMHQNKLPKPYRINGTVRFDPLAILRHIEGGHALDDLPEAPEAPVRKRGAA